MTVLFLLLKISVTVVLVASIREALVLSWRALSPAPDFIPLPIKELS